MMTSPERRASDAQSRSTAACCLISSVICCRWAGRPSRPIRRRRGPARVHSRSCAATGPPNWALRRTLEGGHDADLAPYTHFAADVRSAGSMARGFFTNNI
jgi:hypothetical protein